MSGSGKAVLITVSFGHSSNLALMPNNNIITSPLLFAICIIFSHLVSRQSSELALKYSSEVHCWLFLLPICIRWARNSETCYVSVWIKLSVLSCGTKNYYLISFVLTRKRKLYVSENIKFLSRGLATFLSFTQILQIFGVRVWMEETHKELGFRNSIWPSPRANQTKYCVYAVRLSLGRSN